MPHEALSRTTSVAAITFGPKHRNKGLEFAKARSSKNRKAELEQDKISHIQARFSVSFVGKIMKEIGFYVRNVRNAPMTTVLI
jgi:hypothetical protein